MGAQGLVDVVAQRGVFQVGEVLQAEILLGLRDAAGRQRDGAGLLVHDVVGVDVLVLLLLGVHGGEDLLFQPGDELLHLAVEVGALVALAGDDEGGAGLVDEDGVHLVHDGEDVAPLHHVGLVQGHVVPQIVKAHLVVGAVGDVAVVGGAALLIAQTVDDQAHGEAQEAVPCPSTRCRAGPGSR